MWERRFCKTGVTLATRAKAAASDGTGTIVGHAAVFNTMSCDLGGWKEMLAPGCFTDSLDRDDLECYSLFNHDPNLVLGTTTNDSLRLKQDKTGLYQETDLDGSTTDSRNMEAHVRTGRISRMSFAFMVAPVDGDKWDVKDGGVIRTVQRVSLLADVSPVTYAAYDAANVGMRSIYSSEETFIRALLLRAEHNLALTKTDLDTLKSVHSRISAVLKIENKSPEAAPARGKSLEEWQTRFNSLFAA